MYSQGLGKTHGLRKASRNRGFSTTINIPADIAQNINAKTAIKKTENLEENYLLSVKDLLNKPFTIRNQGVMCMRMARRDIAPSGWNVSGFGVDPNSPQGLYEKVVCTPLQLNGLGNLPYVGGNQLPYVGGNQLSPGGDRSSPTLSGGMQRISTRASACRAMGGTFQQYSTNPEIDPAGDCYIQLAPPAPPPPPAPAPLPPPAPIITVSPNIQTSVSPQISPVFQQAFQPTNSPMTAGTTQTSPTAQSATTPTPQPAPSYAPQPVPQPAPSYTPPPAFYAPPAQVAPVPSAIPPAYAAGPLPAIAADNAPIYDASGTAITSTPIAPVTSGKLFSSPLLWGALAIGLGLVIFSQKGKK